MPWPLARKDYTSLTQFYLVHAIIRAAVPRLSMRHTKSERYLPQKNIRDPRDRIDLSEQHFFFLGIPDEEGCNTTFRQRKLSFTS